MTVKSDRELNRAVLVGGIFILMMTGVAFTVGALSNVYFYNHEVIKGRILPKAGITTLPDGSVEVPQGPRASSGRWRPPARERACSTLIYSRA